MVVNRIISSIHKTRFSFIGKTASLRSALPRTLWTAKCFKNSPENDDPCEKNFSYFQDLGAADKLLMRSATVS